MYFPTLAKALPVDAPCLMVPTPRPTLALPSCHYLRCSSGQCNVVSPLACASHTAGAGVWCVDLVVTVCCLVLPAAAVPVRHSHTDVRVPDFDLYRRQATVQALQPTTSEMGRRAFTYLLMVGGGVAAVHGAKNTVVDFLGSMSASADVLAMAKIEIDLTAIPEGVVRGLMPRGVSCVGCACDLMPHGVSCVGCACDLMPRGIGLTVGKNAVFKWRGKPLFVRHRTQEEIDSVNNVDISSLRDPEADTDRVVDPKWLIILGE